MGPGREQGRGVIPLTSLQPGRRARVRAMHGGRGFAHRLATMGIMPGTELLLVKGGLGGPLVVQVGHGRYILGRGMGHRIMVEPLG